MLSTESDQFTEFILGNRRGSRVVRITENKEIVTIFERLAEIINIQAKIPFFLKMIIKKMILPFIEVRAEKTFRELPKQLVQSSYALGCSRFYTIWKIVLPACKGEIVSGVILGGCYAMGATAPLIFTGAVAYSSLPARLTAPAMALPMHLYLLVAQGATSMDAAYGTAFVMMALILISNLLATIYARRSQKKWNIS